MNDVTTLGRNVDLPAAELVDKAILREEGVLSANEALTVNTGARTGRSPRDRFIVKDAETTNSVDWNNINQPFERANFDRLWASASDFLEDKEHFVSHLWVGAEPTYALPVTVITELAWHNLFAQNLFIREAMGEWSEGKNWTVLNVPSFNAEPQRDHTNSEAAVILDMTQKRILICGTLYAGEMKKAMFSVLNYILPAYDVLPMHCAANKGQQQDDVALFFGLSGTGKTTLSADPERYLIGDDEHGWSKEGVFNFEGGCYAKCINLSQENEPVIWNAIRYGTIMENVTLHPETGEPLYADDSLTQNTRAAYPREFIPLRVPENRAGKPKAVIFLTCDLYGVLPPVSLLTKEQAAYHFLSGYTAHVGSTEVGSASGVAPTFSTCFGAPFFPRPAQVYANLLMKRVEETGSQVYLVNTGWTGGAFGKGGKRFSIPTTRSIIRAILSGELRDTPTEVLSGFDLRIPTRVEDIDPQILNPKNTWADSENFETEKQNLIEKFVNNFKKFKVSDEILNAGPDLK
ncbi:MAG: phosphoenolpyruvate carboxykinase [Gammaproteobacteria bacterium]|nr:phosphoenolpyruvate carboxykinase [Gammaproteobacteria bacterium]